MQRKTLVAALALAFAATGAFAQAQTGPVRSPQALPRSFSPWGRRGFGYRVSPAQGDSVSPCPNASNARPWPWRQAF